MNNLYAPLAIARIVMRNITPLVGILLFHWSAANVLILYFLDTLLSMGVIFAGLARKLAPAAADGRTPSQAACFVTALLACAFMAVPLGMPIGILLATSEFSLAAALRDESLRIGALVQCALAVWSYRELYRALETHSPEQLKLKQRFGLVLMRWVAVLAVCYSVVNMLPGSFVVLLLVATYIAASIFAEIAPDRFLRGTPADESLDGAGHDHPAGDSTASQPRPAARAKSRDRR